MKRQRSNRSSIAWFKLADFVARKEKERALVMLRLFTHSMANQALACQLEGDILAAFLDVAAFDRYFDAAFLFQKAGMSLQAIEVALLGLEIKLNSDLLKLLVENQCKISNDYILLETFSRACSIILESYGEEDLFNYFSLIKENIAISMHGAFTARLTVALMLFKPDNFKIETLVNEAIFSLQTNQKQSENDVRLRHFVSQICALDQTLCNRVQISLLQD